MTEPAADHFSQWKATLQGANMIDILNAMEEIVREGDWRALGLLTVAGQNVPELSKRLPIKTSRGKLNFDGFRAFCIERLQQRLGVFTAEARSAKTPLHVFISYSHRDREAANALAIEIAKAKADVFLDHWDMGPQEEILPRIERELGDSDAVVALLSRASVSSGWVKRELETVIARQQSGGKILLLPVLLEECEIPQAIHGRPYHDFRDAARRAIVAQAILNQIFGIKPFSQRVKEFLDQPAKSPYTQQAQLNGRRILQELAKYEALEVVNNQAWLLWEAFHRLLEKYRCTLKLGRQRSYDDGTESYQFTIIDRWNEKGSTIILTPEELDRGLWRAEIDLMRSQEFQSDALEFAGSTGRLSLNSEFNAHVDENTADASARDVMAPVLRSLWSSCKRFDEGSQQSFLFDLQRLVMPVGWHRVHVIVGSVPGGETLAFSPLTVSAQSDETSAVFELYDPFFSSLKFTQVFKSQLGHLWEGDVDLMSPAGETLLGLA